MPHSHHSHSGQFCGHAKSTLEEVVQHAIAQGFHMFALTEHIPRPLEDFYPEEINSHNEESLAKLFDDFVIEARRLKDVYADRIQLLVGFESEYIRPSTLDIVQALLSRYSFDLFMGSLHHVHTVPIDFDRVTYEKARNAAGGMDERLFEDYFDSQFEMLQALRPPIVGHFDLIRLLSDHRDSAFKDMTGVWTRIRRNLDFIASYGGLLELNASGLRKGLAEPYPCLPICQMFLDMNGGFVMSDDSHGIEQVGTNYLRLLEYIQRVGIGHIYYADAAGVRKDSRFPSSGFSKVATSDLAQMSFWVNLREQETRWESAHLS